MRKASDIPNTGRGSGAAAASAPAKEMTVAEQREARIAELRAQYVAGTYRVDSTDLSRKMVDAHLKK